MKKRALGHPLHLNIPGETDSGQVVDHYQGRQSESIRFFSADINSQPKSISKK